MRPGAGAEAFRHALGVLRRAVRREEHEIDLAGLLVVYPGDESGKTPLMRMMDRAVLALGSLDVMARRNVVGDRKPEAHDDHPCAGVLSGADGRAASRKRPR